MIDNPLITPSESNTGKILDFVCDALRKSGIDDQDAQLIIEHGGLLQHRLISIFRELAKPLGNLYATEKTKLINCRYSFLSSGNYGSAVAYIGE